MPEPEQPFVFDSCCGYQSLYYDFVQSTKYGYLCQDYRRRLYCGSSRGWVRPHIVWDSRAVPHNAVATMINSAGLSIRHCCWMHGSMPCTSHSTANASQGDAAYGLYGAQGESCPMFQSDVQCAEAVVSSMKTVHLALGIHFSVENPAYGTFPQLPIMANMYYRVISYCCYGFDYR
jgi:hypothetical protein